MYSGPMGVLFRDDLGKVSEPRGHTSRGAPAHQSPTFSHQVLQLLQCYQALATHYRSTVIGSRPGNLFC